MRSAISIIVLAWATVTFSLKAVPQKGRIVNGVNAAEGQAPFIVSLSDDDQPTFYHNCGGSIIDKEWILTAAHCLPSSGKLRLSIFAGYTNAKNRTCGQDSITDYAVIHPKYEYYDAAPYDIALLHLEKPLKFNKLVKPIALPYPGEFFTGKGRLYGWGKTNYTYPNILQTVETDILEYADCKLVINKNSTLHPVNICSSSPNKKISACHGDSGGPFVKEFSNGVTQLLGVASWVYKCGQKWPLVFTKVSAFFDWIAESKAEYYKNIKFCKSL